MTTQAEFTTELLENIGVQPEAKELMALLAGMADRMAEALQGDILIDISPATTTKVPTASAWTRDVVITIENAAGDTHDWLNGAYAAALSVGDTSSAGTASIVSTTLTIVSGTATIVVSGDAAAWLGGTAQIETITCTAGESTGAGNITMEVTSAGMTNSPKDVVVAIGADDDTVGEVGALLRAALENDSDVSAFFDVSGAAGAAILTAKTPAANDATLAFAFTDTDSTGVTFGASADTEAGVAKETDTLTLGNIVIAGITVTGGTSVETISD